MDTENIEVEVDSRGRISLGRLGIEPHRRYLVAMQPDGEIRLVPLVSIPEREMIVWTDPALRASLERGMQQAHNGEARPLDLCPDGG